MTRSHCFVLQHDFPISFYPDKNQLVIDSEEIHLEPLQARLLSYFIEKRGQVVSTQQIAADVWQRTQVSDNLVRQVISLLRSQLQDKSRPYRIIQTIPKQGYLFDIEIIQPSVETTPVVETPPPETKVVSKPKNKTIALITTAVFSVGLIATWAWQIDVSTNDTAVISAPQSDVIPVYIHDITLDSADDYEMSESVYNYLFYGLNSARNLSGYHFSQLSKQGKQSLANNGVELKGWLKQKGNDYVLSVLIQNNRQPNQSQKVEKSFSQDNFFDAIGDVILEIKAIIAPMSSEYGVVSHRVTSIVTTMIGRLFQREYRFSTKVKVDSHLQISHFSWIRFNSKEETIIWSMPYCRIRNLCLICKVMSKKIANMHCNWQSKPSR